MKRLAFTIPNWWSDAAYDEQMLVPSAKRARYPQVHKHVPHEVQHEFDS